MAGGLSFLGRSADDTSFSPEMQAWLAQQQPDYAPAAVAPGSSGYVAPTAPVAADPEQVLTPLGRKWGNDLASAVTAPRDAYTGDLQVFDPATGHVTDEAIGRAGGMAGLAMTGSIPFSAPAGAIRMFGGRNAATADQAALAEAERLAGAGADRRAIWDQTGWFKGPDDKWRFEIPDNASKLGTAAEDRFLDERPLQGKVAGNFWHKDLYDAYPDLRRLDVNVARAGDYRKPFDGSYNGSAIYGQASSIGDARQLMLHELQHGVQDAEGFARGGNHATAAMEMPDLVRAEGAKLREARASRVPDYDFFRKDIMEGDPDTPALRREYSDYVNKLTGEVTPTEWDAIGRTLYRRLAGEVEARNVQTRRDFTPEQRRATPPWETQDVPDAQQIVRLPFLGRDR
jgi:hypothetical protein